MTHPTVAIRAYRAAGALAILTAVVYQVAKGLQAPHWSAADYFSYFTILSNLFAAGILLAGALKGGAARSAGFELLRGAAVVYMLTTGIVYAVLLSGQDSSTPWVNTIVHRVMPVAMALDWVIDPPRTQLAVRSTLVWLSFPLAYIAYTLIRGSLVNWYPYFFVNPHHSAGYLGVAVGSLAVGAGILALILLTTWVGNSRAASIEPLPSGGVSAR
ncbi:MAG: Pr6Pr family membrane protein [Solirubrobacteraceae bacterium]